MTEYLDVDGGRIAYEETGSGPLVVLSHGIGDRRQAYRFLAPRLAQAGYRVASADLRGHGESSMGWTSVTGKEAITRTDIAHDLLALIRHLGGPAVIVGHSISGGAATIAAAMEPELVSGIVEINPFTKTQKISLGGLLRIGRYRRGMTWLVGTQLLKNLSLWMRYLDVAYPTKPADYAEYMAALAAKLREPGRMAEFMKTGKSTPAAVRLVATIKAVLGDAVRAGGSTLRDYKQADGSLGSFQHQFRVYGREGEPCVVCKTPIKRGVIGGRSSHYCPRCQK